jgi:predicted ester cyclase
MSGEENKAIERRFKETVWDRHDPDAADKFIDPDVEEHNSLLGPGHGLEGYKRAMRMVFSAFPDAVLIHEDLIAEGDKVVERWTMRGTHRGEFMGIPPTNKQVTVGGIDIYRYKNGRRVETWSQFDGLGLLRQLGVSS